MWFLLGIVVGASFGPTIIKWAKKLWTSGKDIKEDLKKDAENLKNK